MSTHRGVRVVHSAGPVLRVLNVGDVSRRRLCNELHGLALTARGTACETAREAGRTGERGGREEDGSEERRGEHCQCECGSGGGMLYER